MRITVETTKKSKTSWQVDKSLENDNAHKNCGAKKTI